MSPACPDRSAARRECVTRLASLPWVKNVQVNYGRKQATFTADAESFDEAAVVRALEKEGFGGKVAK